MIRNVYSTFQEKKESPFYRSSYDFGLEECEDPIYALFIKFFRSKKQAYIN